MRDARERREWCRREEVMRCGASRYGARKQESPMRQQQVSPADEHVK